MRFRWLALLGMSAAGLFSAAATCPTSMAQEPKTLDTPGLESSSKEGDEVVTVAIAPLDRLLPNINHVMRLVGAGAQGAIVNQAVNGYTSGLDRSRPIGALVALGESGIPVSVAALPISDLEEFLQGLELFGEPEDLGEGLYSMTLGANTVFAQYSAPWLFVSSSEESLEEVSVEAADRLNALSAKHDLLVEVNVQNIPDDLVDLITSNMRSGFEQTMQAQSEEMTEEELEATRASGEQMMENMEEIFESTEKFVVGLAIRPKDKVVALDFGTLFVDGSRYAKQLSDLKNAKASLAGLIKDDSMMTLKTFGIVAQEDMAQVENSLDTATKAAFKSIDESAKSSADAEKAKEYIKRLVKLITESGRQGQLEGAINVTTNPSLNIVAALSVADGKQVEALAADLAKDVGTSNTSIQVQLMTGKQGSVNLHKVAVTLPEEADDSARKVWGDVVNISIGTAPKAVYLAVGKNSDAALKSAIDGVAANPTSKAESVKMRLDLTQLLNFIQSIESNPVVDGMLSALSDDDDQIQIDSQVIERGAMNRLTIQEGVLKAISGGVKAGMAAQGGGDF
ncbi:MAG: hypothetical protein ACK5OB_19770 [Pirellula sp.]